MFFVSFVYGYVFNLYIQLGFHLVFFLDLKMFLFLYYRYWLVVVVVMGGGSGWW